MWQVVVQDNTGEFLYLSIKQLGCRCESFDDVPSNLQQEPKRVPHRGVIVDYANYGLFFLRHI